MRVIRQITALLFFSVLSTFAFAQDQYRAIAVGFYNLENLFYPTDDPEIRDTEFTPEGEKNYTYELYNTKLGKSAEIISEVGTEFTPDGLAILGVAEVENRKVLEDLAQVESIKGRNYQIIHGDSPDKRGIDVALMYQPKYFQPDTFRYLPLMIYEDDGERIFTRDILHVTGQMDGETVHILVNHWPSRRGGAAASAPRRNAAAMICKQVADSLTRADVDAKILVMGDFNDDPSSPSLKNILDAKRKKKQVQPRGFYNPYYDYYKRGIGTTAWRDAWSLFDQVLVTKSLIDENVGGYQLYKARIHNPKKLQQRTGRFKGYPFRSFVGDNYLGGYSDHFPVALYLIKKVQ